MRQTFKLTALVAILLLLGQGAAQAQFRFGIKAGMTINKIHFDNVVDNFDANNRSGFTGGVMAEFQVPIIGICVDASLMYARMNSRPGDIIVADASDITPQTIKSEGRDYFQIPLHLKWKIGLPVVSKIITPYIFTGPDFAFRLGGRHNVFRTKEFQTAWNVGLGVELVSHLQISGGYSFGMNKFAERYMGVNSSKEIKARNNYWTITAAYLF